MNNDDEAEEGIASTVECQGGKDVASVRTLYEMYLLKEEQVARYYNKVISSIPVQLDKYAQDEPQVNPIARLLKDCERIGIDAVQKEPPLLAKMRIYLGKLILPKDFMESCSRNKARLSMDYPLKLPRKTKTDLSQMLTLDQNKKLRLEISDFCQRLLCKLAALRDCDCELLTPNTMLSIFGFERLDEEHGNKSEISFEKLCTFEDSPTSPMIIQVIEIALNPHSFPHELLCSACQVCVAVQGRKHAVDKSPWLKNVPHRCDWGCN